MKVVLVHGFNVRDRGERSIDKMKPYFQQLGCECDIDQADYGFWTLAMMMLRPKRDVVERLKGAFADADLICTHSNGAHFSTLALNSMSDDRKRVLVHFSPAVKRSEPKPANVVSEYVFHSTRDGVVRWLAPLVPLVPWGRSGSHGKYPETGAVSLDETPFISSHSAWFNDCNLSHYVVRVLRLARKWV